MTVEAHDDGVLLRPAAAAPTAEERRRFLTKTDRAYAELRGDRAAWSQELAERRVLDRSLPDGLESEEDWAAGWEEVPRP